MGLRNRLLLLALLPSVPAWLLALYSNLEHQRAGVAKVERDAMKQALLVAAGQNGLIEATRQHLSGLSHLPQALNRDTTGFDKFFADLTKVFTNYSNFGLIETNGDLVSSSLGHAAQTNLASFLHFRRAMKSRDLAAGEYDAASGSRKTVLPFAYPLLNSNGQPDRVLFAALNLEVLGEALAKARLSEGEVIEVFDLGGHVLARYPNAPEWIGKVLTNSPIFARIASQREGSAEVRDPDGELRLWGFAPLHTGPEAELFVCVGIPRERAFAGTRNILIRDLTILFIVAVLALIVARIYAERYVLRPVRALGDATRRLGGGDLSARTSTTADSGELSQLARSFDDMAETLQRRKIEGERTAEQLRASEQRFRQLSESLENRIIERTAQLEASNRELESFCYSVSHDLRAPLRHITGFANLLDQSIGQGLCAEDRRSMEIIGESAERMGKLIDDLLLFSRMGRIEMQPVPLDLRLLVEDAIGKFKPETSGRNIVWKIGPLPEVTADPSMMGQVVLNLLSNALKYTRPRNPAQIEMELLEDSPDQTVVCIRDNGVGFDMKYADKLFGVFQRLHLHEEFEGTGIGLANVRRIMMRHGGRVWAEGKVDVGATFYFSLPKLKDRGAGT